MVAIGLMNVVVSCTPCYVTTGSKDDRGRKFHTEYTNSAPFHNLGSASRHKWHVKKSIEKRGLDSGGMLVRYESSISLKQDASILVRQNRLPVYDHQGSSHFTFCACQDDKALEWIAKLPSCSSNCNAKIFGARFSITENASNKGVSTTMFVSNLRNSSYLCDANSAFECEVLGICTFMATHHYFTTELLYCNVK